MPNGQSLTSTSAGFMSFPHLPAPIIAYMFPDKDLRHSLLCLAQFCAQGCLVTFNDTVATITNHGSVVLQGSRRPTDSLWHFPLDVQLPPLDSSANAAISISSDADYVRFAHAALGSPSLSTLTRALRAGYTWQHFHA